jgi:chromodomain-helicase-DNA-binding protein 7
MARCHRIGQRKDVTVYRLVCNDTYEQVDDRGRGENERGWGARARAHARGCPNRALPDPNPPPASQTVFDAASKKYGLDEAILGCAPPDPEANAGRIADLLKHGAMRLDDDAVAAAGDAFAEEGIDQILAGRTERRAVGGRAGNTFSVATFAAADDAPSPSPTGKGGRGKRRGKADADGDRAFWAALLPDAVAARDAAALAGSAALGPRARNPTKKTLNEAALTRAAEGGSGSGGREEGRWFKCVERGRRGEGSKPSPSPSPPPRPPPAPPQVRARAPVARPAGPRPRPRRGRVGRRRAGHQAARRGGGRVRGGGGDRAARGRRGGARGGGRARRPAAPRQTPAGPHYPRLAQARLGRR